MKILLTVSILLFLAQVIVAQEAEPVDQGRFKILKGGELLGYEQFRILSNSLAEGSSELNVGVKTTFSTRTEYRSDGASFNLLQPPGVKLQVSVDGREVKMTGVKEATAQTEPAALLLENNVWYQYHYLLARYDRKLGGRQRFSALVPSLMMTVPVSVELVAAEKQFEGVKPLTHYRVSASVLALDVWAEGNRLIAIHIPAQSVEVLREGYEHLSTALKQAAVHKPAVRDYSAPADAPFTAEEVVVDAVDARLAGTLLLPKTGKRPFPAVVTITGSGQQTRDEPLPIPGLERYGLFKQLAEHLAAAGVAVLRVDDRGVGGSSGRETLEKATTFDFAADTAAQVKYLMSRPEIDKRRIFLVGHSEGGVIAPFVAVSHASVAGIVLMAGTGKPGAEVIMDQVAAVLAESASISAEEKKAVLDKQREMLRAAVEGRSLEGMPPVMTTAWYREFLKYDPVPTIRKVKCPILILHGALDRQVTVEQAEILAEAAKAAGNKQVTLKVYPQLNHLFLKAKTGAVSEYSKLQPSVDEEVLNSVRDWILKQ